jgi:hypothetical protein
MSPSEIKIGKYKMRNGDIAFIKNIPPADNKEHPMYCVDGYDIRNSVNISWTRNGFYFEDLKEDPRDLIEFIPEEEALAAINIKRHNHRPDDIPGIRTIASDVDLASARLMDEREDAREYRRLLAEAAMHSVIRARLCTTAEQVAEFSYDIAEAMMAEDESRG